MIKRLGIYNVESDRVVSMEKITFKSFVNHVLTGTAQGTIIALIPNAVLPAILSYFTNFPLAEWWQGLFFLFRYGSRPQNASTLWWTDRDSVWRYWRSKGVDSRNLIMSMVIWRKLLASDPYHIFKGGWIAPVQRAGVFQTLFIYQLLFILFFSCYTINSQY